MSLIDPNVWDKILPYKRWIIYGALGIVLIGLVLFLYDCGSEYIAKSKITKQKEAINAEVDKIANSQQQIIELEKEKSAAQANVNAATEELQKNIFGLDQAKQETNQALANLQRATNSNSNVDRSAEDLKRILERLGKE
jgi:uncharacterized membrane protein YhiD involved in acid resistance